VIPHDQPLEAAGLPGLHAHRCAFAPPAGRDRPRHAEDYPITRTPTPPGGPATGKSCFALVDLEPPGYRAWVNERHRLEQSVGSPRAARELVREEIQRSGWTGDADVAVLLTSELVCNALEHGGGRCDVLVALDGGGCLRVDVADDSPDLPVARVPEQHATSGRGLFLMEQLASSWGAQREGGGKHVWFDLESLVARRGHAGGMGDWVAGAA